MARAAGRQVDGARAIEAGAGEEAPVPGNGPEAPEQESGYTEEEEAIIAERLRDLGYLE